MLRDRSNRTRTWSRATASYVRTDTHGLAGTCAGVTRWAGRWTVCVGCSFMGRRSTVVSKRDASISEEFSRRTQSRMTGDWTFAEVCAGTPYQRAKIDAAMPLFMP